MKSNVLVIGSGGREHALAWRLSTSTSVSRVIVAPGNAGMELSSFGCEFERWNISDFEEIAKKAIDEKIALVVVGPDNALADGIVDLFEKKGLICFGPTKAAARIEWSKEFAKDVMKSAGIPTAKHFVAKSVSEAHKILKSVPWPKTGTSLKAAGWVVKADGLALGKGVEVCTDFEAAVKASERLIAVSGSLVIEELLSGVEVSWFAICDGEECVLMQPARDYKRLKNEGQGPNTGGMGAYSPLPEIPKNWAKRMYDEVFSPTLREMGKRGVPFKGLLYAGLMCDFAKDHFSVIEFNSRFGDPEAQVLLPRMTDDLYDWCLASAQGGLRDHLVKLGRSNDLVPEIKFSPEVGVGVVVASPGYPDNPEKGKKLSGEGLNRAAEMSVEYFYAGVSSADNGSLQTSGGRVYLSLGIDAGFEQARKKAYARVEKLQFDGMQFRTDIAAGVTL